MECSICKVGEIELDSIVTQKDNYQSSEIPCGNKNPLISHDTKPGHVTVTLEKGDIIVLLKHVPAEVCQNCGHYYLDSTTTAKVLKTGQDAVLKGSELEIVNLPDRQALSTSETRSKTQDLEISQFTDPFQC